MSDLSKLTASVARLRSDFEAYKRAAAPSDQKEVDDLTGTVNALADEVEKATPKAGDAVRR